MKLTVEEFEEQFKEKPLKQFSKELDMSVATLSRLARKHNIRKGRGRRPGGKTKIDSVIKE